MAMVGMVSGVVVASAWLCLWATATVVVFFTWLLHPMRHDFSSSDIMDVGATAIGLELLSTAAQAALTFMRVLCQRHPRLQVIGLDRLLTEPISNGKKCLDGSTSDGTILYRHGPVFSATLKPTSSDVSVSGYSHRKKAAYGALSRLGLSLHGRPSRWPTGRRDGLFPVFGFVSDGEPEQLRDAKNCSVVDLAAASASWRDIPASSHRWLRAPRFGGWRLWRHGIRVARRQDTDKIKNSFGSLS